MAEKPTYEELEQRVRELEQEVVKHNQVEEALAEKSMYLDNILRSATEYAIATTDKDFRITYYNPLAEKFFGYTAKEVTGKTVQEVHTMENVAPERFERAIESIRAHGEYRYQVVQEGDNGTRYLNSRVSGIYNSGDELVGFALFSRDVTGWFKAEKSLRESEEKFRKLFDCESDALALIDVKHGNILEINQAFVDLYGYSKEEVLQMKNTDFSAEPDKTKKATQKMESIIPIRWHKKKNGTVFPVEITAKIFNYREQTVHIASIRDITERKQVEEALRESEEKYRSMMEAMKDATYICSSEFRIEYMNPRMISRIGRDAAGELCHKAIYNSDEKCSWCVFDKIQQGQHHEYELANPKDNRHYSITNSPIFHSNGLISKLTIFRDITKNKAIESQLRQARKMETIGTLAGGIAHDFNNILFPIVGSTEMLLEDIPKDSPMRGNLHAILNGAIRAKKLVKQILAFSRQDSHEVKLMRMQPVIKDALKLIRSTIPLSIEMKQTVSPDCGAIKADPTQIHQVVMNLATNAYHAMEDTGGELKVNLKEVELGGQDLSSPDMEPGPYACLTVTDTGTGIDENIIAKIFDPYFTTKKQDKGTGMGLATIHGIVLNAGGNIQVNSELGKGTEFNIYLPIVQHSFEQQKTQTTQPIQGGTERILLVDDEDAIVFMEQQMLERLGYSVVSRTSSVEALEAFRANSEKFDLVITDMSMPNMSGDKLASELVNISPGIPIVLCTGFSEQMPEERAKALGIKGFLMKPITIKDLSEKIREVLDNTKG